MILAVVLLSIALAMQPTFSFPIFADPGRGFDYATEIDNYYGPLNNENRWWSGLRGLWPLDVNIDTFDFDNNIVYGNPTRTIDVGRDRYSQNFAITENDYWVRDQKTYRSPRYRTFRRSSPRFSSVRGDGDLIFFRR